MIADDHQEEGKKESNAGEKEKGGLCGEESKEIDKGP